MPNRIFDDDPELGAEATKLRDKYRNTKSASKADELDAGAVSLEDFYAYMPMHQYMFAPARSLWPAASVNARIPPIALTGDNGEPVLVL